MRYEVSTYTPDEQEIKIIVSMRADADKKNLFKKCASEMHHELCKRGLAPETIRFGYDLPNIWRNGAVGCLWFVEPFYNICIAQEGHGYIAC